jgi:hypothetical protein
MDWPRKRQLGLAQLLALGVGDEHIEQNSVASWRPVLKEKINVAGNASIT